MIEFGDFIGFLEQYVSAASEEYSTYERTRHSHFVFEGLEGSHKKSVKHWLKVLDKGVHGAGLSEEMMNLGEEIVERATPEVKGFYFSILKEEDKVFFLQVLMKKEIKLLNLDLQRYEHHKEAISSITKQKKSTPKSSVKPNQQKSVKEEPSPEQIAAINEKEFLTVKEVVTRYGISVRSQASYRIRRPENDPIPFIQNGVGGKVLYKVKDLEEWLKSQKR